MMILAWLLFTFMMIRMLVVLTNLFSHPWLKPASPELPLPPVSILIPARNEAGRIDSLLGDLSVLDEGITEILVYDDQSDDGTADVVARYAGFDARIRLLSGTALPAGWLGKNHACDRLAGAASGEWLLFLDADVRVGGGAVRDAVAHARGLQLDLLSQFPVQVINHLGEAVTVPIMNWVLTSLLPLRLSLISSWPSLAAANGQFMLFRSGPYRSGRFHAAVREQPVEDIAIMRLMKQKGLRTQVLLGRANLRCRMYGSYRESVTGFAKNLPAFFGNSRWAAFLFWLATGPGYLYALLALPPQAAGLFLAASLIIRAGTSQTARQKAFRNFWYSGLQWVAFGHILWRSIRVSAGADLSWKGRPVRVAEAQK